ncbi:MAG TPA: hypothetical protein VF981_09065 [Gemmatimonadaceae bacterium]
MYATCLFCNEHLGKNESIDLFPVGTRLAFDGARGRLWVVCPKCERWNLTPLEERLDAIEQSEKLYRDTRKRVATDNIGLAKLRDGTTLVRIGEPLRPEFAAWRYGDQFGRRRRRQLLYVAGGAAAVSSVFIGAAAAGLSMGAFAWMFAQSGRNLIRGDPEKVVAKIRTEEAGLVQVRRRHLGGTSLSRGDDGRLALNLRFKGGEREFTGREAERIASILIPKVNRYGGNQQAVRQAVEEIESVGSTEAYMELLANLAPSYTTPNASRRRGWRGTGGQSNFHKQGLFGLPGPHRLALEMALHEEAERRAMQGELRELELAWQDAEEVAAISDSLTLPESVTTAFEKLKKGQGLRVKG